MKPFRSLLVFGLVSSLSLTLLGCTPPNPIVSTQEVYSTKLKGERLVDPDRVIDTTGSTAEKLDALEGNYRDIQLLDVTRDKPRQLLFTELTEDSFHISRVSAQTAEQLIADVPQVQHVTPLEDGGLIYMIPDLQNLTWQVKKLSSLPTEPRFASSAEGREEESEETQIPSDTEAEVLYDGKIESVLKKGDSHRLIYIINAGEEYQVYINGNQVWQYPERIVDFIYEDATSRYAALVQKADGSAFLVKTSFMEVEGEYSRAHGIELNGDKLSFFGRNTDQQWIWYIDGETTPWAPEIETDRVNEVISVARKGDEMWALVSMRASTDSGLGTQVIRRTYAINSRGEQMPLPGEPSALIDTEYGWKTIIGLASRGGYQVYNISKNRVEDEASEIQVINISPATDIWYVKRAAGYSLWNLHRGKGKGGEVLEYVEPIHEGEQTYLLVERSNGAVELLEVEP